MRSNSLFGKIIPGNKGDEEKETVTMPNLDKIMEDAENGSGITEDIKVVDESKLKTSKLKISKKEERGMFDNGFKELVEANKMIEGKEVDYIKEKTILETIDFFFKNPESFDTISMFYKEETRTGVLMVDGPDSSVTKQELDKDTYLEICESRFKIKNNGEKFNVSASFAMNGALVRSFAMVEPVSKYPNITLSAATPSELDWDDETTERFFKDIVKDNFILVGASGAGKTYLMNYLLKKTHENTKHKIGIIEEFSELFEPTDGTFKLTTPPVKPGEESLLRFLTEQSNLMRLNYLYVGEIKSAEAWPFVSNLSSGTKGACTLHGSSARDGLRRLSHLCLLSGVNKEVIYKTIAKTIKHVIYIEDHKIREIIKLTGGQTGENFQAEELYGIETKP